MLYLGLIVFACLTFAQPQLYVPFIKGKPVVALVMGTVGAAWALSAMTGQKMNFGRAPQNVLMVLLWAVVTLSTLSAAWWGNTYDVFIEWGKNVVIYFLIIGIVQTAFRLRTMLWAIVLSMAVTGCLGILQSHGIDYSGTGAMMEGRIRGLGIFGTNQLAYALCFCMPLAFGLFITTQSIIARLALIAAGVVYAYAIFLTQSRGGFICMLAVVMLLFILFGKSRLMKIAGIIVGMVCIVVLMKFAPRFSSTFDYQSDRSAMGRIDAWSNGLLALKEHPLFGIGKGQFVDTFNIAPHNSYIEAVTELGIAGLFLWLGLFYFSFRQLWRAGSDAPDVPWRLKVIARVLMVSLAAYLVGSYFSSSAYYIPLYMLIALAVIVQRISSASVRAACTLRDVANVAVIEAGIIVFIHWMVL